VRRNEGTDKLKMAVQDMHGELHGGDLQSWTCVVFGAALPLLPLERTRGWWCQRPEASRSQTRLSHRAWRQKRDVHGQPCQRRFCAARWMSWSVHRARESWPSSRKKEELDGLDVKATTELIDTM
jgi:hypothetical protein